MRFDRLLAVVATTVLLSFAGPGGRAQDLPEPVEGDYVIENFGFNTGETIPELNVHYTTLGDPSGKPVLVLHGTTGTGSGMASGAFADGMFGPGDPFDAQDYYVILPDSTGTGGSSKPSDGMRAKFPRYNYDDMVEAQYRLVKDGLGIDHLRAIIGNSMGGMHVWTWGVEHPAFADALIPMASLPGPMAGRNWMMRRMLIDSVRNDPAWQGGDYTEQPPDLKTASTWFSIATSNGEQGLYAKGSTNEAASAYVDEKLANQKVGDANDTMYQWDSSRDFDPSADLEKITAHVLVIDSADDERNPEVLGILEAALPRMPNAQVYIIPGGPDTRGHSTTGSQPELYAKQVADFLATVPEGE